MRTKRTIGLIVLGCIIASLAVLAGLIAWLGAATGIVVGLLIASGVTGTYLLVVGPWQRRWGATDEEVRRAMPGDAFLRPDAPSTTRAITVDASPEVVFPWLLQIGYGRGGWYSYDWIDNDGRPSADRIVPELQQLKVGDQILMLPEMGPRVREIQPDRYLVAGDHEGSSWCLALYPTASGSRLVSRWRVNWPLSPATAFWILVTDPGAFIMERRMLKGIKARAERAVRAWQHSATTASPGREPSIRQTSP